MIASRKSVKQSSSSGPEERERERHKRKPAQRQKARSTQQQQQQMQGEREWKKEEGVRRRGGGGGVARNFIHCFPSADLDRRTDRQSATRSLVQPFDLNEFNSRFYSCYSSASAAAAAAFSPVVWSKAPLFALPFLPLFSSVKKTHIHTHVRTHSQHTISAR